jgi:hypothetical protein
MWTGQKKTLLAAVEAELKELELAEDLLKQGRASKALIFSPGGAAIEVDLETALEYLDKRRAILLGLARKLVEEESK